MPDARREELEHDQREAGDEQEVRDPRRHERVCELLREVELVESNLLVRLQPGVLALADDVGGIERDLASVHVHRLLVERDDEVADGRLDAVRHAQPFGGTGREASIHDVVDAVGAAAVAVLRGADPFSHFFAWRGPGLVEPHRVHRSDAGTPRDGNHRCMQGKERARAACVRT